jgi:hypothetical protein
MMLSFIAIKVKEIWMRTAVVKKIVFIYYNSVHVFINVL